MKLFPKLKEWLEMPLYQQLPGGARIYLPSLLELL